ncbi:hypothetical protein BG841_15790 [Marinobacter sp. X15-166B]|nr:hypothetical protein BG841_15790 [Marinobacter sp. X15-166B]
MIYLVSFFLHLPARFPPLGVIRFDLILVGLITFLILSSKFTNIFRLDDASKYLLAIFIYAIVSLPLVQWPGSVINTGLIAFIKGAIFYFFTVNLVIGERRLKLTIIVFVVCNLIRVIEPLMLHLTTGYLGSKTHLGGGEFASRLSGAPSDIINPNGLAFVIATVIPFLHYVFSQINKKAFFLYLVLISLLMYTMVLTLSRSGILALGIIALGIWIKSSRKLLLLVLGGLVVIFVFMNLSEIQKDRYLSIVSDDARQSASATGRIQGWFDDFEVAMNRPIIGHGLGTSMEANWNVRGVNQVSHILWAEIWQEIGLIGLLFFVLYLMAMIKNFIGAGRLARRYLSKDDFVFRCVEAMQVWLLMNFLFSFASYGLKSYEWYFFGGLSVTVLSLVKLKLDESEQLTNAERSQFERFPLARKLSERNR